jgi:CBS domain-containing protein
MKVKEIMTCSPSVCDLNESLAEAAKTMWDADCGVLPVVKDGREVVGLITDRDICMAMAVRDCQPDAVSAEEVITGDVYSVAPEDELQTALELMQQHQVHRLPVINPEGELEGMLSMNDIVLTAKEQMNDEAQEISYADVVDTYKAICAHRAPGKTHVAVAAN